MRITDGLPKVYREHIQNFPEIREIFVFCGNVLSFDSHKNGRSMVFYKFSKIFISINVRYTVKLSFSVQKTIVGDVDTSNAYFTL